ncbi:DUF6377 domain-containing protein [Parabacteroides sp. OttesenSCG-928-K15]|nr:DUF6377 domain-containing protein [Parabacteroides sp. OttesenSCG-928-K15]
MRKELLLIVVSFFVFPGFAATGGELDSLLSVLDQSIQKRETYRAEKLQHIRNLEAEYKNAVSHEEQFNVLGSLYEAYKNFQMDTTLLIAERRADLAEEINNDRYRDITRLNKAEVMVVTGMYKEALDILDCQDRKSYTPDETAYLFHLYHSLYMLMADYSITERERNNYLALECLYKDSILQTIGNPQDVGYQMVACSKLMKNNRNDEALELGLRVLKENITDDRITAMLAHTVAEIYKKTGDRENQKKYLALSAIGDMKSGVREYMSLQELAELLFEEGDINRSYLYMKCSLEDAIYCRARLRALEISRILPIINTAYDVKMKKEKDRLLFMLLIITILVVVLVVSLLYIYKQLKALAKARRSLKVFNEELKQKNDELNKLNADLSESNHVKEEYISYVFTMCSSYIDKMEDFRKRVNRKIKANQAEELYRETKSNTLVNDELKEFYKSFDTIFLNIYPDFVSDFNNLLYDDARILPKEGEMLTPELRIYALVRLGIGDSVKIASFLHYSPQTVYNYRLKVRNKAKVSKENFPETVKQLGKINL